MNRGDYEVISPYDGQIIRRSEFAGTVQPGMTLEMSIILRRGEAFQDIKRECPRCYHINRHVADAGGWIEWKVPFTSIYKLTINNQLQLQMWRTVPSYTSQAEP